jgi:hypothetical protein
MDRGIPTEEVLAQMRQSDPPVQYLVGTPKGRLTQYEPALLQKSWQEVRPGVRVKLLPQDQELYVLAESQDRVAKERSMRRRQLKWLWRRLKEVQGLKCQRDELLQVEEAFKNLKGDLASPTDLPSGAGANRSPYLYRFSGLLPARNAGPALAGLGSRVDAPSRARKVCRGANVGCAHSHH